MAIKSSYCVRAAAKIQGTGRGAAVINEYVGRCINPINIYGV